MSKRVTLTEAEIKFINNRLNEFTNKHGHETTAFTDEGISLLKDKLSSEPVTRPKGLLKVHHNE